MACTRALRQREGGTDSEAQILRAPSLPCSQRSRARRGSFGLGAGAGAMTAGGEGSSSGGGAFAAVADLPHTAHLLAGQQLLGFLLCAAVPNARWLLPLVPGKCVQLARRALSCALWR